MEMNFKQFVKINEVLDQLPTSAEANIKWSPALNPKDTSESYKGYFDVDSDNYIVGFNKVNVIGTPDFYVTWDLNRNNMGWWEVIKTLFTGRGGFYDRTNYAAKKGIGYTIKVLEGVFACIKEFVQVIRPSILSYDEHDGKLKAFYDQVATKIAPKFGYKPYRNHSGFLVRSDKYNSASIAKAIQAHLEGKY